MQEALAAKNHERRGTMQPVPTKVSNVQIYPYIPGVPIRVLPVFVDGSGTLSFGTLATHLFYDLSLLSGRAQDGGAHAGQSYYATYSGENGQTITTPWMYCCRGGDAPQFGRTIDLLGSGGGMAPSDASGSPDMAYQLHLTDVFVSMYHDPREPIEIPLIEGATALATFAGLLPGGSWKVTVDGGKRVNSLQMGARVTIAGKQANTGRHYAIPAVLVTTNAGDPAQFVEQTR